MRLAVRVWFKAVTVEYKIVGGGPDGRACVGLRLSEACTLTGAPARRERGGWPGRRRWRMRPAAQAFCPRYWSGVPKGEAVGEIPQGCCGEALALGRHDRAGRKDPGGGEGGTGHDLLEGGRPGRPCGLTTAAAGAEKDVRAFGRPRTTWIALRPLR